jgi:ABC-2 type transport system ATP-binding protein
MYEADEICDRVAIMERGKIAALDKPSTLKETIGGEPWIHIRVKDSKTEKALAILKKYNTMSNNDEIRISAKNPWEIMNEVSDKLVSQGVYVEKMEVVEPTLEDVFIKLSGRKLTEEPQ